MALFQKSVLNKYLSNLDQNELSIAFSKFKEFYGDAERIENIKLLKEENYQEGFLREIFVEVLGYTINPDKNYNLTTEFKNETDSKKADGAILKDTNAIGVIELKSTKTVNLESITTQAFNYKNHQSKCKYVITSNFDKLNFYIDNATEWQEFNLFTLSENEFALFYLLLSAKNLLNDIPEKIKKESRLHEENISDKLYKDYSQFKHKIYNNLVKNNPQYEKLVLFKKSQKLLDRVLFVLFAEDSGLVPPNAISRIVDQYEQLKELDEQKSLYSRFVKFFSHLNEGHNYKEFSLPAYNGGLFKEDEILDIVHIDDEILLTDIIKLSSYDFSTEVDVNILGHIFEHSLTEIEELTAELEGTLVEREKTKRKKDGIFYTPKYITKYIVDNTIGALCDEKKRELNLYEIDIEILENSRTVKGNLTAKAKSLFDNLELYRNYILSLKILDPACGSGAFLNQALEFLISEHKWIDEHKASLLQEAFAISEFEKEIVENNIYGVDINEEAVEIAKLSLWLRTAKKGRKLSTLSDNIKCGNSLIDDPEIAGDKAFNWNEEFKEIMQNGGFDVVIGNPPYVGLNGLAKEMQQYFEREYKSIHTGYNDLMYYFLYKGHELLGKEGVFGVITSNYFIGNDYAKGLRVFLSEHIISLVNFEKYNVFKDASVHTAIIISKKNPKVNNVSFETYKLNKQLHEILNNNDGFEKLVIDRKELGNKWIIADAINLKLMVKLKKENVLLGKISEIAKGTESGKNEIFTVGQELIDKHMIEKRVLRKCVKNSDINSFYINTPDKYLIYADNEFSKEIFPNAFNYLELNKKILCDRRGPRTGEYEWWRLHRPSIKEIFDSDEKILVPYRAENNRFGYDDQRLFNNGGDVRAIKITNLEFSTKYITAILNSFLIDWFYGFIGKPKGKSREYFNKPLSEIPIKEICIDDQKPFIHKTDKMLSLNNQLLKLADNFIHRIKVNFELVKISQKLQSFYDYDFKQFRTELKKQKIELTLKQQDEWEEYFNEYKTQINKLQEEITKTDNQIDVMVYKLYNLNYQEVKIVEPEFWMSEEEYANFSIDKSLPIG